MSEGPAGYPLAIMTDSTFSIDVADADFATIDTADARTVARLRHELSQWLRAHFALDPVRLNDVLLAVNEALTNAAEFAYAGDRGRWRCRSATTSRTARWSSMSQTVVGGGMWIRRPDRTPGAAASP